MCQSYVFCLFFIKNQINASAGKPSLWILVRGVTGPLEPKLQISLFCVVKFHVSFAVCNTWFFRESKQSPYLTNFRTSPTTYLRNNDMHYILVPMLIASGTAWNTLFCMRSPRRFWIDRAGWIFRTNQLRKTHLDDVSTPTPGPSNPCALRNFIFYS